MFYLNISLLHKHIKMDYLAITSLFKYNRNLIKLHQLPSPSSHSFKNLDTLTRFWFLIFKAEYKGRCVPKTHQQLFYPSSQEMKWNVQDLINLKGSVKILKNNILVPPSGWWDLSLSLNCTSYRKLDNLHTWILWFGETKIKTKSEVLIWDRKWHIHIQKPSIWSNNLK